MEQKLPSESTTSTQAKKTKKVVVKKKKGEALTPDLIAQAKAESKTKTAKPMPGMNFSECGLNLDPNLFSFVNSIPQIATQSVQKTMESVPQEQLEKMSFQDITKLVTSQFSNFPLPVPTTTSASGKTNANSFDMNSIMVTLMQNASKMVDEKGQFITKIPNENKTKKTEQNDNSSTNAFPSVFDAPPDRPDERSSKYYNPEEEKKRHIIYKGFNVCLLSLLTMLTDKLPHKTSHYASLRRMIEGVIEVNHCKPREIWKDSIKGREERVQKFSQENVEYICKNLNSIELLNLLELDTEWDHFTSDDYKTFWLKLNQLQNISELIENIPVDMMTAIQDMTLRVNQQHVKVDEKGMPENMGELFKILSGEVFNDGKIFEGMQSMSAKLVETLNQNQMPLPPGYSKILEKANNEV